FEEIDLESVRDAFHRFKRGNNHRERGNICVVKTDNGKFNFGYWEIVNPNLKGEEFSFPKDGLDFHNLPQEERSHFAVIFYGNNFEEQ
ncbi:MAG TPA: hypothetical protein VHQ20_00845, partial [Patescibacteria group bacterium]|nr:hypothetical protein [Patescibacteria group bacterium]